MMKNEMSAADYSEWRAAGLLEAQAVQLTPGWSSVCPSCERQEFWQDMGSATWDSVRHNAANSHRVGLTLGARL